jgi:hypothetical protein
MHGRLELQSSSPAGTTLVPRVHHKFQRLMENPQQEDCVSKTLLIFCAWELTWNIVSLNKEGNTSHDKEKTGGMDLG